MLSGGDASRLQFPFPKGLYNIIGDNYYSTLFSILMDRLANLEQISNDKFGNKEILKKFTKIKIFIIISKEFLSITKQYFEKNNNFGFENVFFISSEKSICVFDLKGKMVLKDKSSILKASFGNGDLMDILLNDIYPQMKKFGIEYLHISGIDNILNKPIDPLFIGLIKEKNLQIVHKIVEKKISSENVGLFVNDTQKNSIRVMEYTYFPEIYKQKLNKNKTQLKYRHANMLNFMMTRSLVEYFYQQSKITISEKRDSKNFLNKINFTKRTFKVFNPFTSLAENRDCIKMERFFLDCFPMIPLNQNGFITVEREEEFAPIKSKYNSKDTPQNALQMFSNFSLAKSKNIKIKCESLPSSSIQSNEYLLVKCLKCSQVHLLQPLSSEAKLSLSKNNKIFVHEDIMEELNYFPHELVDDSKFYSLALNPFLSNK